MANEIFRPLRVFAVVSHPEGEQEKVPLTCLGVGYAHLPWKKGEDYHVIGIEVHGKSFDVDLSLRMLNEGEAVFHWSDLSFNFTLFHAWIKGLSLDEREGLIHDVLSWQEEVHIRAAQHELQPKKIA